MATAPPVVTPPPQARGHWDGLNVFEKYAIISAGSGVGLLIYGLNNDIVLSKGKNDRAGMKSVAKSAGQFFLIIGSVTAFTYGAVKIVGKYWNIDSMHQVPPKANAAIGPASASLASTVKSAAAALNLETSKVVPPPVSREEDKRKWDEFVAALSKSWDTAAEKKKNEKPEQPRERMKELMIAAHEKVSGVMRAVGLKKAVPTPPPSSSATAPPSPESAPPVSTPQSTSPTPTSPPSTPPTPSQRTVL